MSRVYQTVEAIVVGRVEVGEADLVVHLLTANGRCSAFAASGRKSRRRFGASLEPFTSVKASLGRRKASGLFPLVEVEYIRGRSALAVDLERFALAAYASELSERVAPEGAPTELMNVLTHFLDHLSLMPASLALRRAYELMVLRELGAQPQLEGCVECGEREAWFLDFVRGGVFCGIHNRLGREIGPRTRAWLQHVCSEGFLTLEGPLTAHEANRAARAIGPSLDRLWMQMLDSPLRTAAFLEAQNLNSG